MLDLENLENEQKINVKREQENFNFLFNYSMDNLPGIIIAGIVGIPLIAYGSYRLYHGKTEPMGYINVAGVESKGGSRKKNKRKTRRNLS